MSIFGDILARITGHAQAAQPGATPAAEAAAQGGSPPPPAAHDDAATAGQPAPIGNVDVAAILNGLAAKSAQRLDWQHSIVDLMKLLGLDSSLESRKALAQELHYEGGTSDTAMMNVWLHRQVMQKLAENGGRVPEELRR
ncbi:DUF3597 domain-containing protein [Paracraurococcus lichenis]|uniref:DUF3597 domain-containing protein n=1 Tax=Paracraurococcus lichenis TaxID=3064888 RepID=A0ABT9EAU8_9PROT|nr:DUF3597 domain-containing protein [Paracraurococcus sp. LOR1-02]MDO9713335.1 DUF3597 domain-containing protein [Paracraurococcus sp. LOR1-02]